MKQVWFYKHVFLWSALFAAAAFLPRIALSAEPCESKVSAALQKKSVDIEMAVIAGELSDLEVASKKEGLQKQVKLEKEHCRRLAAISPAARVETGSF